MIQFNGDDAPDMRISSIFSEKNKKKKTSVATPLPAAIRGIVEKNGMNVHVNEMGGTKVLGLQMDNPFVSPTEKGRKRKSTEGSKERVLEPPGRYCGNSKEFTYKFDVIQMLKQTDKVMMEWLFYWMLVLLPKSRILP